MTILKVSRLLTVITAWAVILVLQGCSATWQKVEKDKLFKGPGRAYLAMLPAGWKRAPTENQDHLLLTQDGLSLNSIAIYSFDLDEAFPQVAAVQKFTDADWRDVLPEELSRYQLQQLQAGLKVEMEKEKIDDDGFLAVFSVKESMPLPSTVEQVRLSPAMFGDVRSFRLDTVSYNTWGLKYNTESYGFVHEGAYWLIQFSAPELHWWAIGKPEFDKFRNQIQLKKKCVLFCD